MKKKPQKSRMQRRPSAPKECYFCKEKKEPWFSDSVTLARFTTERGKIMPATRSGLCAHHQKRLTTSVKHARHLALLPFIARV